MDYDSVLGGQLHLGVSVDDVLDIEALDVGDTGDAPVLACQAGKAAIAQAALAGGVVGVGKAAVTRKEALDLGEDGEDEEPVWIVHVIVVPDDYAARVLGEAE